MIVVSHFTEAPDYEKINGITYGTTSVHDKKRSRESRSSVDFAIQEMGHFYRHVLIEKRFPHHTAI